VHAPHSVLVPPGLLLLVASFCPALEVLDCPALEVHCTGAPGSFWANGTSRKQQHTYEAAKCARSRVSSVGGPGAGHLRLLARGCRRTVPCPRVSEAALIEGAQVALLTSTIRCPSTDVIVPNRCRELACMPGGVGCAKGSRSNIEPYMPRYSRPRIAGARRGPASRGPASRRGCEAVQRAILGTQ